MARRVLAHAIEAQGLRRVQSIVVGRRTIPTITTITTIHIVPAESSINVSTATIRQGSTPDIDRRAVRVRLTIALLTLLLARRWLWSWR
jgi:hypothetical protein